MPDLNAVKPKSKGEETRSRILAAALDSFRERGFEETTMREIAERAGMATGAAYYYFPSKDALVLAFYHQAQSEMEPLLEEALAASRDFKQRLRRILEVKLKYFHPSRRLLGALAAHTDPQHPLSPFGEQAREIRENDMRFFKNALNSSNVSVKKDMAGTLPRMLWMYQMGIILFWIYDRSEDQRKTWALIDKSLHIIVRLIQVSGLPLMSPVRRMVLDLVNTMAD